MAALILPSRRAVQPLGLVGIDGGNPIAMDCREALVTQGNHHVFVGTGAISQWAGSIQSPIASPKYGVGGQNYASASANALLMRPIATTSGATVMTVGRVSSAATQRVVTTLSHSANGSQLSVLVGDGVTPGVMAGRAYLAGANGDFGGSFTLPAGSDYVAIVRQRYNVQQDLWVNGVQDPVTTSRAGAPVGYTHFGRAGSQATGIPLFMAAVWGRALTDAEMREISQNPWQLLCPIQRRIIVDMAAGGGPTIYRPAGGATLGDWTSTEATLWQALDETVASDADYITSPGLTGTAQATPAITLSEAVPAGSYTVRVRSDRTQTSGQIRVVFYNASDVEQGATAWQAVTGAFVTYELPATLAGVADRFRIEAKT